MHLPLKETITQLNNSGKLFLEFFKHGTLCVEIYKPDKIDRQQPHSRDEVYIVVSGCGEFINGNLQTHFTAGDFLFVAAGVEHRFINFTEDFITWVIFYGAEGGEK